MNVKFIKKMQQMLIQKNKNCLINSGLVDHKKPKKTLSQNRKNP